MKQGKEGPLFGLEEAPEGENVTDRLTAETAAWIREQQEAVPEKPPTFTQTDPPSLSAITRLRVDGKNHG